jgi:hypothetical protein
MIWREEQRGIVDIMRQRSTPVEDNVMGFARFIDTHDEALAPWFAELEQDLKADKAERGASWRSYRDSSRS